MADPEILAERLRGRSHRPPEAMGAGGPGVWGAESPEASNF